MKACIIEQKYYPGMTSLKGPANDAIAMKAFLSKCGFTVVHYGAKRSIPPDTDLLYITGHGMLIGGATVFVCPQPRSRWQRTRLTSNDYISSSDIPRNTFVIADCCFSGGIRNAGYIERFIGERDNTDFSVDRELTLHRGIFACSKNSTAADLIIGSRFNGAFTFALLAALKTLQTQVNATTIVRDVNSVLETLGVPQRAEHHPSDFTTDSILQAIQYISEVT